MLENLIILKKYRNKKIVYDEVFNYYLFLQKKPND